MNYLKYAGAKDTNWNLEMLVPCEFVNDGEVLAVNVNGKAKMGTVTCAVGYHARVQVDGEDSERWVNVMDTARRKT